MKPVLGSIYCRGSSSSTFLLKRNMCNYSFAVAMSLKNHERGEHQVAGGGLDETSSWKDLLSRLNRARLSQAGQLLLRGRRCGGTALPFALLQVYCNVCDKAFEIVANLRKHKRIEQLLPLSVNTTRTARYKL